MKQMSVQKVGASTSVLLKNPTTPGTQGRIASSKGTLIEKLRGICGPACPACHERTMVCCYTMPEDYNEVAPKYYQCTSCANCYAKVRMGPWVAIGADELPLIAVRHL